MTSKIEIDDFANEAKIMGALLGGAAAYTCAAAIAAHMNNPHLYLTAGIGALGGLLGYSLTDNVLEYAVEVSGNTTCTESAAGE